MIPCIIIPADRSSIFRQAKENTARAGLSAIAMARQAALLLLTIHGYELPDAAVPNDSYRQAMELDLRGKREYTEAVLSAMGGIKKAHFSDIKKHGQYLVHGVVCRMGKNIPTGEVALRERAKVFSADEHPVGHIENILVNPQTEQVTNIVIVKQALLATHRRFVPVA